jgi:hypothetical protein
MYIQSIKMIISRSTKMRKSKRAAGEAARSA